MANLHDFDLVRVIQNSTLDKRFFDLEARLHNESTLVPAIISLF